MSLTARKFQSLDDVNVFLKGGITSSKDLPLIAGPGSQFKLFGLHGLTLVFGSPALAGTVTFSDANNQGLDLKAVAAAILAQTTTNGAPVRAKFTRNGTQTRLTLIEATPASGVSLTGGTARNVFGFPAATVTGLVYDAPDGTTPPRLIATEGSPGSESIIIITEDA